jgi:allantoicase
VGADHNTATLTPPFTALADLASARVGGRAIAANDEFFAPKSSLLKAEPAIFIPDKFTPRGKWMDGWETRRRRTPGHDWCVIALGMRGQICGINVDTSHFTGNYPSHCSLEGIDSPRAPTPSICAADTPWVALLPMSPLRGNTNNFFPVVDDRPWTHLRLNIFPDGGVSRLRIDLPDGHEQPVDAIDDGLAHQLDGIMANGRGPLRMKNDERADRRIGRNSNDLPRLSAGCQRRS